MAKVGGGGAKAPQPPGTPLICVRHSNLIKKIVGSQKKQFLLELRYMTMTFSLILIIADPYITIINPKLWRAC